MKITQDITTTNCNSRCPLMMSKTHPVNILKFADLSTSLIITRAVLTRWRNPCGLTELNVCYGIQNPPLPTNGKMFASVPGKMLTPRGPQPVRQRCNSKFIVHLPSSYLGLFSFIITLSERLCNCLFVLLLACKYFVC